MFDKREALRRPHRLILQPVERDNRPLKSDEEKSFRAVKSDIGRVDVEISDLDERIAELEEIQRRTAERAKRPSLHFSGDRSDPWSAIEHPERMSGPDWKSAAIGMVERSADRLGDGPAEKLTETLESGSDAVGVAKVVAVGSDPAYRTAWLKVVRDHQHAATWSSPTPSVPRGTELRRRPVPWVSLPMASEARWSRRTWTLP